MVFEDQLRGSELHGRDDAGRDRFSQMIGDGWAILFSHPKDFTPVCTTELGYMARLKPEFDKRHTKIIGLSVDPVENHSKWALDIEETQGHAVNYPMIGDTRTQGGDALRHAARGCRHHLQRPHRCRQTLPCARSSSSARTRRSRRC